MSIKKALFVIASSKFRDEELFDTQRVLESNNIEVEIVSNKVGEIIGMLGGKASVKKLISDITIEDFDALIFIGGSGASMFFNDQKVIELVNRANELEQVIGAICIAPIILANSGILEGKKATVFLSESEKIIKKGAKYIESDVVVDGDIVTASGPQAAEKFGQSILSILKKK